MKRHAPRLLVLFAAATAAALPAASAQASSRSCAIASVAAAASALPTTASLSTSRRETLCLLNRERAQRGLRPLRLSTHLNRASVGHSRNMVRKRFFQHGNFVARILNARYVTRHQAWSLGENIALGTG